MKYTPISWINDIIYVSFKRLSLFDYSKNLYSFLCMHMDVSCIGIYSYMENSITQLFKYEPFAKTEQQHKVIHIDTALLRDVYASLSATDRLHKVFICESREDGPEAKVMTLLRGRAGSCLHMPLDYGDVLGGFRFINLYADHAGAYTQQQCLLCENLQRPLRDALTEALQRRDCTAAAAEAARLPACPTLQESAAPYGAAFKTLDAWTADYIRLVIRYTNGRISGKNGAAVLLGLPPTTLWSKMRKLKINPRQ